VRWERPQWLRQESTPLWLSGDVQHGRPTAPFPLPFP
jgi:hypothetical protein